MAERTGEFNLFPAIDILGGRCVRLLRGDYDAKTEYSANPEEMAKRWIREGAKWLHVVDLDAAKSGLPTNTEAISRIVKTAEEAGVSVQVGGGIRNREALAHWLSRGVRRCVVGTAATNIPWVEQMTQDFGSESFVVGLDGRNGKLAVKGWLEQTETLLAELAAALYKVGVRHALVTDVDRDGTLQGANLALASDVQRTGIQAIASGGVKTLQDVLDAQAAGLAGAIVGRSIYDGTLSVSEALNALREVGRVC